MPLYGAAISSMLIRAVTFELYLNKWQSLLAQRKRDSPAGHMKTRMRFVELEDFHQEVVFRHGSFLLQDEIVVNMAWRTVSLYCFPMSFKDIKLELIKPLLPVTLLIVFGKRHELKKRSETILVILIFHVFSFHGIEVCPELPTNILHPRMLVTELVFVRRMKPSKRMPDGDHCEVVVFALQKNSFENSLNKNKPCRERTRSSNSAANRGSCGIW